MEEKLLKAIDDSASLLETIDLNVIGSFVVDKGLLSNRSIKEHVNSMKRKEQWFYPFLYELAQQGTQVVKQFLEILSKNNYGDVARRLSSKLDLTDTNDNVTNGGATNNGNVSEKESQPELNSDAKMGAEFISNGNPSENDNEMNSMVKSLTLQDIIMDPKSLALDFIDEVDPDGGLLSCCKSEDDSSPDVPDLIFPSKGSIDVVVKKATKFYSQENHRIYRMGSKPKGFALILVNQDFASKLYKRRDGAGKDQQNLTALFEGLGYVVYDYFNKSSGEMRKIIQKFSQLPDHEKTDSCVVAISTHGEPNRVVGTDNECIWMEDIVDMFNNEQCPRLKNKPKLFFVQACRGHKYDAGVDKLNVADSGKVARPNKLIDLMQRSASWTDIVIAYSTIPEHVAIRHKDFGSWFIVAITNVFANHAYNTPLSNLFHMVTEEMENFETSDGEKQVPEIVHRGWKRDLYFNPGLFETDA